MNELDRLRERNAQLEAENEALRSRLDSVRLAVDAWAIDLEQRRAALGGIIPDP